MEGIEEHNESNLKRGIGELQHKQAPDIWMEIEKELPNDNSVFKSALQELPTKEAPDVWLPIEANLPEKKSRGPVWMVAASLALFVASLALFLNSGGEEKYETISYGTENVENFNVGLDIGTLNTGEDELLSYIQKNCRRLALTCNDPEFKGLLETYIELSDAKNELVEKLEEKKNHPQLMKYLIRVEKNQTDVGKDMLKKLRNS